MPFAAGWLVLTLLMQVGTGGGGPSGSGKGNDFLPPPMKDNFILSAIDRKPAAPSGSAAFVRLYVDKFGTQSVLVRVFGLAPGSYDVLRLGYPDNAALGSIVVADDGQGQLAPPAPAVDDFMHWFLDYDTIEVRHGAEVLFSGTLDSPNTMVLG